MMLCRLRGRCLGGKRGPTGNVRAARLAYGRSLATAVVIVSLAAASSANAQPPAQPVGRTVEARGDVQGTPPGGAEVRLTSGDPLVLDHLVLTGRVSAARLAVGRGGSISLGQESRLRLDQERIDAATGRTQSTFSLLLGRIELALGRLFQGEITIETPTATLGIRGTLVRVFVDADGRTIVAVLEGTVEFTSRAGGSVLVRPGFFSIVEQGAPPTPPAPFDLRAAGLSPSARAPDFVIPGEEVLVDSPLRRGQFRDVSGGQLTTGR